MGLAWSVLFLLSICRFSKMFLFLTEWGASTSVNLQMSRLWILMNKQETWLHKDSDLLVRIIINHRCTHHSNNLNLFKIRLRFSSNLAMTSNNHNMASSKYSLSMGSLSKGHHSMILLNPSSSMVNHSKFINNGTIRQLPSSWTVRVHILTMCNRIRSNGWMKIIISRSDN